MEFIVIKNQIEIIVKFKQLKLMIRKKVNELILLFNNIIFN